MRLLNLRFLCLIVIGITSVRVSARELNYRVESIVTKNYLGFGYENSIFKLKKGDIKGSGAQVDFQHALNLDFTFQVFISTALNSQNSVSSSFTGLGSYFYYSVYGQCCETKNNATVEGVSLISESRLMPANLLVGIGVNQYTFNGTSSTYPASGLGFSIKYQFNYWKYRWFIDGKQTSMSIGSSAVSGTSFLFGILLPI
jgi:hypothetical protein